jgi:hypothetical protein
VGPASSLDADADADSEDPGAGDGALGDGKRWEKDAWSLAGDSPSLSTGEVRVAQLVSRLL